MRKLWSLGFLVTICGVLSGNAADPLKPNLKACTVDWPPYTIIDPASQKITGIEPDAFQLVGHELGYETELVTLSWNRCLKEAEDGKMLVITASKAPERLKAFDYIDSSIINTSYVFVGKKDDPQAWDAKRDVSKLPKGQQDMPVVGSPEGFSVTKKLEGIQTIKLDTGAKDDAQNLQKFLLGRLTTIVGAKDVLRYCLKKEGKLSEVSFLEPDFTPGTAYFLTIGKTYGGSRESAQALKTKLEAAYKKIHTDGRYKAIAEKYTH